MTTVGALRREKPAGGGDTYYLLITYDEQQIPASDGGCAPSNGTKNFSRVREVPYLAFTADWPNPKLRSCNFRDLNCGIFLASYLGWTPPCATFIDGVQGRYFLPIVPLAFLVISARLVIEMKQNNMSTPYVFRKQSSAHRFLLNFGSVAAKR